MRRDMAKVVTEKPRYGHANPSKKTALRVRRYEEGQLDDLPKRIPSSHGRQHGWNAKEDSLGIHKQFSDKLGPLRKFLHSRVGQHWDKIYSELSQNLDKRSLTGLHIWDHVWQFVEKDCLIGPDKKVYRKAAFWGKRSEVKGLYIHPKTGVLSRAR